MRGREGVMSGYHVEYIYTIKQNIWQYFVIIGIARNNNVIMQCPNNTHHTVWLHMTDYQTEKINNTNAGMHFHS